MQRSVAYWQRPAKAQPLGLLEGLGTCPVRMIRFRFRSILGSAMGIAEIKALV